MMIDSTTEYGRRVQQQLTGEQIIWLTTVSVSGVPQTSPVWFWWDGECFHIFSREGKPKLRNIAQNPQVSLHFNCDPLGHEVTVFNGTAVLPNEAAMPAAYLDKYQTGIKGLNMTPAQFQQAFSAALKVTPTAFKGH